MDLFEFRLKLRQFLMEEVHPQAIIMMAAFPGKKAEYESFLKVVGFDKAMSPKSTGFGGDSDEDVGAWKIVGIPEVSELGKQSPSPWALFMDWLWKFLKDKGFNPVPYRGFGDTSTPYGKLKPYQKRQRKYGVPAEIPLETDPAVVSQFAKGWPSKQYAGSGVVPGPGYDAKRDIMLALSPMGTNMDDVYKNFDKILKSAPIPNWFKIESDPDNYRWSVVVNIDTDVPEGWKDRLEAINAYKSQNRERWNEAVSDLAGGRTNPLQLAPLVRAFLVVKHGFQPPLSIDVLDKENFEKAINIVKNTKLEDIVEFAKSTNRPVPVISQASTAKQSIKSKLMTRWNQIVKHLADQGVTEPYVIQVALADYMTNKAGFPDPFEPELLTPQQLSKAINVAGRIGYDDLDIASVQESIKRLTS